MVEKEVIEKRFGVTERCHMSAVHLASTVFLYLLNSNENLASTAFCQVGFILLCASQRLLPGLKTNKHWAHLHSALGFFLCALLFFKVAKALSLSISLLLSSPFFVLYIGVWWVD